MKNFLLNLLPWVLAGGPVATAQSTNYTNFIRQHQYPSKVKWDVPVAAIGEQLSALAIDPGGARFELWTVRATPLQDFLLDTRYVGAYVPMADVMIRSEDSSSTILRTRADRPFWVDISVAGLLSGETVPVSSTKVKLLHHVQSYGTAGTVENIDRKDATIKLQSHIAANGVQTLTYTLSSVPGPNLAKIRGEERFSVFSLEDYQAPECQLASQFIQIWPVADGAIAGLTQNQKVRFSFPQITLTMNDLYPSSTTYAQVYPGNAQLGKTGKIVPGSALPLQESVPQNRTLTLKNYDAIFDEDGRWTMELVTATTFGIDRLAYVSFDIDRTLRVKGSSTTVE